MSYIRSRSNAEGLYIWGGIQWVNFSVGQKPLLKAPVDIWNEFLKVCGDDYLNCEDIITHRGMTVIIGVRGVELKYSPWERPITMYYTTWRYLVDSNQFRYEPSLKRFLSKSWFWIRGLVTRLRYGF